MRGWTEGCMKGVCISVVLDFSSKWARLNQYCEKILNGESKDSGPTLTEPPTENHDIYLFPYYLSPQ